MSPMPYPVPRNMKAARLVKYNEKYEIKDIPVPQIGANDVLLKVGAAGFCHTDYQVYEGIYKSPCPITPSHEPVGTIVACGFKARENWKPGQRVGMITMRHSCGKCIGCKTTHDTRFCENKDMAGISADGGFAEYVVADADNTVELPKCVEFEQAAPLMCAGATVWTAITAAEVPAGQPIGVLGIGGLGSLAVQFCKALGHPTVAIDNRPEGRALATEFPLKADLVIDYTSESAAQEIRDWTDRGGLAGIIVCTDDVDATAWSIKTLRPHGICVPLGLPPSGFHFDAFDLVFNMKTIKGALVATQSAVQDMMGVVAAYGVRSHITTVPFEEVMDLPDRYMDKHLKGRLVMKF